MLNFLGGKPIAYSRKQPYTLVAAINLDRAYFVAFDVLKVSYSEPFIGEVILSSFFPASFLTCLLGLLQG